MARRRRSGYSARREPRRHRTPSGGRADARLRLASTALFREEDGVFRRRVSAGWDAADADTLHADEPPLAGQVDGRRPFRIDGADAPGRTPSRRSGAPRSWRARLQSSRGFAVVFYGGHEVGNDLDGAERDLLGASPATRGSPMGRLRARCCASESRSSRRSSKRFRAALSSAVGAGDDAMQFHHPVASRRRLRREQVLTARRKPGSATFGSCSGGRQAVEMNGTRAPCRPVGSATARSSATGYPNDERAEREIGVFRIL